MQQLLAVLLFIDFADSFRKCTFSNLRIILLKVVISSLLYIFLVLIDVKTAISMALNVCFQVKKVSETNPLYGTLEIGFSLCETSEKYCHGPWLGVLWQALVTI